MANEFTLNFTAEQIDLRLENAGNAILHTEQELTPEQQEQARKNLGISAGGAGVEVFDLADYGISMLSVLMSGNVKTEQDCTNLVTAVTAALVAGKAPVLLDGMAGVYAFVNAVCPGVQIGGALFGDMGSYIMKADVVIATDAIYLYTSELSKE